MTPLELAINLERTEVALYCIKKLSIEQLKAVDRDALLDSAVGKDQVEIVKALIQRFKEGDLSIQYLHKHAGELLVSAIANNDLEMVELLLQNIKKDESGMYKEQLKSWASSKNSEIIKQFLNGDK